MGIRTAGPADETTVRGIVEAAYRPWAEAIGMEPPPLHADYADLIARGYVHVLQNGEPEGVIVLRAEEGVLLVENVAVRPDRQGRGLGRRLMAFAELQARDLGLPALRLFTNEGMDSNRMLYESLGFRETGREGTPPRRVVHMRKDL